MNQTPQPAGAPGRFEATMHHYAATARGYEWRSAGFPWSLVKNRERSAVLRALGSVLGEETLDLGCGIGYFTTALLAAGASRVFAVDACREMLDQVPASDRVTTILARAEEFDLPARVPAAICAGMLEFVEQPRAVLERARRAVAPSGRMSVLVPGDRLGARLYRRFHRRHGIEVRLFAVAGLRSALEDSGWWVEWIEEIRPFSIVARVLNRRG